MGGKKRIRDMGGNKNIHIKLCDSDGVFRTLGIDPEKNYLMDVKSAIFRLYDLQDPDLSINSPQKTLGEQRPNHAYGIPITNEEMRMFMGLFGLRDDDFFQEGIGGRIVKEILTIPIDRIKMKFTR